MALFRTHYHYIQSAAEKLFECSLIRYVENVIDEFRYAGSTSPAIFDATVTVHGRRTEFIRQRDLPRPDSYAILHCHVRSNCIRKISASNLTSDVHEPGLQMCEIPIDTRHLGNMLVKCFERGFLNVSLLIRTGYASWRVQG